MQATPKNIAVIGAGGGIGGALLRRYEGRHNGGGSLFAIARRPTSTHSGTTFIAADITDEASLVQAASKCKAAGGLDIIVLATGMLHDNAGIMPEKSLRDIDAGALTQIMAVNTIGPALAMKHFLPLLHRDRPAVFAALSARVGSIGDNHLGGWYAYRASKAALNMLIRTASIEMKRRSPQAAVIGLHPGTVDTNLSAPFKGNVAAEKLFSADDAAEKLAAVIDGITAAQSGQIIAWDGSVIPY